MVLLLEAQTAAAETDVHLNPPATPVSVGAASLNYTRHTSVPRVTIPGSYTLTDVVTNSGAAVATNVHIQFDLPMGFSVNNASSVDDALGDLAVGMTITRTYIVHVADTALPGRYPHEAIASAVNTDSVMADVLVDVTRPAVLGASTLAETGQTPWAIFLAGCLFLAFGAILLPITPRHS